jgi:phosphoglycerate dehydrogenase-like enzyme
MFFNAADLSGLRRTVRVDDRLWSREQLLDPAAAVDDVEILITGWGIEPLDEELLHRLPALRAVFHTGGSVKALVADGAVFRRGIRVCTANPELAKSVAEFTFALVVLSTRHTWSKIEELRRLGRSPSRMTGPGNYESTVGLIGYGVTARELRRMLRQLRVRVLVYDPYLSPAEASEHDVLPCSLGHLFANSDIVSCHLPSLPETERLIGGEFIGAMKPGATFINTARGAVVNEPDMAAALAARPDLWAVLDVLADEAAPHDSPLFHLPNVTVTPHIAGCLGMECRRLGRFIAEEIRRWRAGEPLLGEVFPEELPMRA